MLILQGSQDPLLLHPRYVLRVAGESAQALNPIDSGSTAALWREGQARKARLSESASALVGRLERRLQGCEDREHGRAALNVKRAVFNGRAGKASEVAQLQGWLDAADWEALQAFQQEALVLAQWDLRLHEAYERELADSSAALAAQWQLPNLQAAISYSNPELFAEFEALAGRGKPLNAKTRRKSEDTLVQYLARCASKTSPLSSFTVMHVGRWDDRRLPDWQLDYQPQLERRLQLKGALMRQILAPLLANYALARCLFPLALNPSLVFEGGRARFRTVTAGNLEGGKSYGTGEAVAEINSNAAIACLHHVFAQRNFEPIRADDLVQAMIRLAPKLQADVLDGLLAKLYDLRLLLPDIQPWEQKDPLAWTSQLLADLPEEAGGPQAREQLAAIEQLLKGFGDAAPAARTEMVSAVKARVAQLREVLQAPTNTALAAAPFFENCYLTELEGGLSPQLLAPFAKELGQLLALAPVASFTQQARCDMADFFLAEFGADGVCHDPLDFIRRFDTIYALGSMTQQPDRERKASASAVSQAYAEARRQYFDLVAPLLQQSQDVQLDPQALQRIVEAVPAEIHRRGGSQSYLGQLALREGARPLFVLNQVFGGRSALMSRFMEVLDVPALREVRDYLLNSSEGALYAELPGVFGFNANHHPQMADNELVIPPFAANWEDSTKFELDKLRMVYDAANHMVRFKTEDGRDLDVWYQGFLMPILLPRIQRVLALAYTEGLNNYTVSPMMKSGLVKSDGVTYVPRVSLGDVVLARRSWIVPASNRPDAEMDAETFFLSLQQWRLDNGLPAAVFVRGLPLPQTGNAGDSAQHYKWDSIDFKDLKPFYLRFDSPRLVRLLQRTLKRSSLAIVCSEVLPALDDQHAHIQGQPHVAELQFELSTLPQRLRQAASNARWQAVRINYHEEERSGLLLGPVRELLDGLRSAGLSRVQLQPHWRQGPHLELAVHANDTQMQQQVWPLLQRTVEPYLQAQPSSTVLDPQAYEALSRRLALFELDDGATTPLAPNNTLQAVPYARPKALKLVEFAEAREDFQVEALPLAMALLNAKAQGELDADALLLTLAAMQALTGQRYELGGLSRGYVSFRSHADYFFAAHDGPGAPLRQRFEQLGERLAQRLDAMVRAVLDGRLDDEALPAAARPLLKTWDALIETTAQRNRRIVDQHYEVLLTEETFARLQARVGAKGDVDFQQRMRERVPSQIGARLASEVGRTAMGTPQIMAYRTSVNFFYTLLPLLGISPMQKFCICHLLALSVERVLGVSWRDITGLRATEVQS